ncbi:MAG: DUF2793 domain-containing protein [Sphingomonas sp.]|nr:DUF2793 domain-containing protein [Sphingomonas sp.]
MSETSARFALPFILPGQAQKEMFHNEALAAIDCALHPSIEDVAIDPPATPDPGESWIVGAGAGGAWADRQDTIATWTGGGWRFTGPTPGLVAWDKHAAFWRYWTGAAWSDGGLPAASINIAGLQVIGPRLAEVPNPSGGTTIDAEARAAIDAVIATLKSHGLIE